MSGAATLQVPVPAEQPAWAGVYQTHVRTVAPLLAFFTWSPYWPTFPTAFHVKVGVAVVIVPVGDTRVTLAGVARLTVKLSAALYGP